MPKLVLLFLISLTCSFAYGQTDSLTREEKMALDSMFKNDEFFNLMFKKKKSFFEISVGAGNQLLSTNNNNANAGELRSSFALVPGVSYTHKSGFGLALNSFFASDSGQFKPYQYSINPYFEHYGKSINLGIYYTRYIFNSSSNFSPNPFQNAFYGNLVYTKTFIEPGLSIGYASGQFTDSFLLAGTSIRRKLKVKLSDFSLSPYVQHNFYFYKLFSKEDGLSLTPSLMLVAGRQRVKLEEFKRSQLADFPRLRDYLKNRFESDSKFQLQSLAGSLTLKYQYKKFYISPNLYLDYYLPSTTGERLTTLFSVVAGFFL